MDAIKEFQAVLQVIVSGLTQMIMEQQHLSEQEALNQLYSSKLYEKLEQENTKVWHLSIPTLYSLYIEEKETGKITFPEEA